jgi:uncharacterized protein (TIGR03437 family)
MRISGSHPGSMQPIAVDMPLAACEIRIESLSDGTTWEKNRLDLSRGDALSFWASGLPENADRHNLRVFLNGRSLAVSYVDAAGGKVRQVNAQIPRGCAAGRATISVSVGTSPAVEAELEIIDSGRTV